MDSRVQTSLSEQESALLVSLNFIYINIFHMACIYQVMSTSKRPKLVSWITALTEGGIDVAEVVADKLESGGCPLTTYLQLDAEFREAILRSKWPNDVTLVQRIAEVVREKFTKKDDDVIELLNRKRLSPSGRKLADVVPLLKRTMSFEPPRTTIFEPKELRTVLFVNPYSYQPQAGQLEEVDTAATLLIKQMETKVVGFKVQEPSGVPVLNVHITCLVTGLENFFVGKKFAYEPEHVVYDNNLPGRNNSVDSSILYYRAEDLVSIVLYEYKANVNADQSSVDVLDLLEAYLYGYYQLLRQEKIIICLTDTNIWHYFSLSKIDRKIKVNWSYTIKGGTLEQHLRFVIDILKDRLEEL